MYILYKKTFMTLALVVSLLQLNAQCDYFYITVAPDFNSSISAAFRLNLSNGDLTRLTPDLGGFITALGVKNNGDTLYLGDPPNAANQLSPIYKTKGVNPLIDSVLVNTNLNVGGPRLCVSADGQYIYTVTSTFPNSTSTSFHLRRSNILTHQEDTALVVDSLGIPLLKDANGDIHMSTQGKLYMIDGPGSLVEIDLSTWSGNQVIGKNFGNYASPFFHQFYGIAQDSKGNLIILGSAATVYRIRLSDKKAVAITNANYPQAYSSIRAFASDAASCSYPLFHTVSGHVYFDANQNGSKQSGENGTGQTLYAKIIYNGNVYAITTVDPVTSYYAFSEKIPNSNYTVVFSTNNSKLDPTSVLPNGFTPTSPITQAILVDGANVGDVDFGLYNSSLAVDISQFTAEKVGSTVQLTWQTRRESNSAFFEIERSLDAKNFTTIGSTKSIGQGEQITTYQFVDVTPGQGNNYYRIKEMDLSSKATFSGMRSVLFGAEGGLMTISPNPASTEFRLSLVNAKVGNYLIQFFDANGHLIQESKYELSESQIDMPFSTAEFGPGLYVVRCTNVDENIQYTAKLSINN